MVKKKKLKGLEKYLKQRIKKKGIIKKSKRATYKIPEEKPAEYRSTVFQREYAKEKKNLFKEGRKNNE